MPEMIIDIIFDYIYWRYYDLFEEDFDYHYDNYMEKRKEEIN